MDYNIKFKYDKLGKAGIGRQKVLQAQRQAVDKKTSITQPSFNRDILTSLKTLNTSIKHLTTSINRSSGFGARGVGGGGVRAGVNMGGASGIGGMGAALPIAGAAIALTGFAIQKINQIGNAYIERTGMQKGNVGVAGFRYGQGMYNAAEIGAGMRAYSMSRGKFVNQTEKYYAKNKKTGEWEQKTRFKTAPEKTALDVGAIYGLSAAETLGQAGVFKRAGANYQKAVYRGAGAGIESEIPMLMTGLSSILEEAVKNGINTSDMSKDIGKEITALTMATPGRSVEAALNMVRSFAPIQKQLGRGKMGTSLENMYGAQATEKMLMRSLTDTSEAGISYRKRLVESGLITGKQFGAITRLGQNATYSDLQKEIGLTGAHTLFKNTALEANPARLQIETIRQMQGRYGKGISGFQKASTVMDQLGWTTNQSQNLALWKVAQQNLTPDQMIKRGESIISGREKGVAASAPALGVYQERMREELVFKHGAKFAETSLKMEKSMIKLAEVAAGPASSALDGLSNATVKLTKLFGVLNKYILSNAATRKEVRAAEEAGHFDY